MIHFNRIEDVQLDALIVDRRIQRDTDESRAQKMADTFDPNQYQPILVARRTYGRRENVVVDGGHRYRMAQILGVDAIPAQIVRVANKSAEAELFLSVNTNRKAVSAMERFKVEVNQGPHTDAYTINSIVESLGGEIGDGHRRIGFVTSLKNAYAKLGNDAFTSVMSAFLEGTPEHEDYEGWLFVGIVELRALNHHLDPVRMSTVISRDHGKIRGRYKEAGEQGSRSRPRTVANVLVPFYNSRLSQSKRVIGAL